MASFTKTCRPNTRCRPPSTPLQQPRSNTPSSSAHRTSARPSRWPASPRSATCKIHMTQQRSRCSAQPARPTANDDDSTTTHRRSQDAAGPTQSSSHATAPCWRAYSPRAALRTVGTTPRAHRRRTQSRTPHRHGRPHTNRQPRVHPPLLVPKPSLGPRRLTTLRPPFFSTPPVARRTRLA